MGFNECIHAYIAARYYSALKQKYGEQGTEVFRLCVRFYAEQRGRRMAKRAVRDGQPLTYETYMRYGEWMPTDEMKTQGISNRSEITSYSPDYTMHIFVCPWHEQFRKMGMKEAGLVYCSDLDASICRGFNPAISYTTSQTLHDHDHCIQTIKDAGITPEMKITKDPANVRSFEYHCAHTYWSFRRMILSVLDDAEDVIEQVTQAFRRDYGDEMTETLLSYRDTDFEQIREV